MLYSFIPAKQTMCYSGPAGWQPAAAALFACTQPGCTMRQQTRRQNDGTNLFCSMKNPRKSTGNPVGAFAKMANSVPKEIADFPFISDNVPDVAHSLENLLPEEESFRNLLLSRLPRQRASQALRDRIKNSIQQMPD